jgi:transcriptional regulator with XRE-family HTH domain
MKRDYKSNIKARGLTVVDLAALLGVTPRQAWNYLTRRSIPRGESIIRLAGILGVTPEDILRGKKPSAKRAA